MKGMNRALITAAIGLGIVQEVLPAPTKKPPAGGHSFRPRGFSVRSFAQGPIADRASSIRKLQRSETLMQPNEKAKMRHAWYRRLRPVDAGQPA